MASKPRSVQSSRWDGAIFLIIPGILVHWILLGCPSGKEDTRPCYRTSPDVRIKVFIVL